MAAPEPLPSISETVERPLSPTLDAAAAVTQIDEFDLEDNSVGPLSTGHSKRWRLSLYPESKRQWLYRPCNLSESEFPRRSHHSAVLTQNIMIIFGGLKRKTKLNDIHFYDIESDRWSGPIQTKGVPPTPRSGHTGGVWNRTMIIFGGFDGTSQKNDVHFFDLDTLTWIQPNISNMERAPSPRSGHLMWIRGNKLIVFGGLNGIHPLNDLHVLDLEAFMWSRVECRGSLPPGCIAATGQIFRDKLILFGGYDGKRRLNTLHVLDLSSFTWYQPITGGSTPAGRFAHSSALLGSKMVIYGGDNGTKTGLSDLWVLDLDIVEWRQVEPDASTPEGHVYHSMCVNPTDGLMYVYGGYRGPSAAASPHDIFVLNTPAIEAFREWAFDELRVQIEANIAELEGALGLGSGKRGFQRVEEANACLARLQKMFLLMKKQQRVMLEWQSAFDKQMKEQSEDLARQRKRLEEEKGIMRVVHEQQGRKIRLNIGGHKFDTSVTTLTKDRDSMLAAMFSGRFEIHTDEEGCCFIDRDGTHFRYILNFLRDGSTPLPEKKTVLQEILREAEYYQLQGLVQHLQETLAKLEAKS